MQMCVNYSNFRVSEVCVGGGWDLIRVIGTCCMSKGFLIPMPQPPTQTLSVSFCFVFHLSSFFLLLFLHFQHLTFLNNYLISV
ncbi:hypothetical protein PHAVU_009G087700 [Phaseolus vulgaris]|uniref:Uncharacterized protein n=1 Tax=Phaseolus vulgaris TaxID=3885 RepID=V7AUE3_PHAVU|nr:hypothetical protein PHAVU_009G087700g [Phaseolus vulgaris]ESW08945.1 hypothetical protein PHAVU_009G087700g [Phaseolus vulgaris]